jgi:hypothetical protein
MCRVHRPQRRTPTSHHTRQILGRAKTLVNLDFAIPNELSPREFRPLQLYFVHPHQKQTRPQISMIIAHSSSLRVTRQRSMAFAKNIVGQIIGNISTHLHCPRLRVCGGRSAPPPPLLAKAAISLSSSRSILSFIAYYYLLIFRQCSTLTKKRSHTRFCKPAP